MKTRNQIESIENQTIIFDAVAPHPEPVAIGELLSEIEGVIKRHVVLSEAAATTLAVWVLHTYVYELRDTVAYVAIESPEKRCGKTTLLSVLAAMANKPLIASNVTVGALFRAIHTCRPTLFIDEADTFLAGSGTMRGIINSGNTWRTAYVLRLSKSKSKPLAGQLSRNHEGAETTGDGRVNGGWTTVENGHDHSPSLTVGARLKTDTGLQKYSCWCPKVIAMIGSVPDTIADRSIVVPMARKLVTETRAPLSELDASHIKAKCARFALDERERIAGSGKIRGDGLNDRAADTFDPLYVIARLAGKDWEEKLHAAARAIAPQSGSTIGPDLLLDIHTIFVRLREKKIFSRDLIEILRDPDLDMKSAALKDSAIDESRISEILRPYGIRPATVRIGKKVGRGYIHDDFNDALARYVPPGHVQARLDEMERRSQLRQAVKAEEEAEWKSREGIDWGTA